MRRGAEWLRRIAYCLADAVTSENKAVGDWLKNYTRVHRSVVIPQKCSMAALAPDLAAND